MAVAFVPVGRSTTAPSIYVDVHVTLTDSKVIVSPKTAPRGSDARFIVKNIGSKPISFSIGYSQRGIGQQTGFTHVFKPGAQKKVYLLFLDYRGTIPYFGGKSNATAPKSMKGIFTIGAQCSLCVQDNAG